VGLVLVWLVAFTVTNILRTLAAMSRHQIEQHQVIFHSRQLRQEYLAALKERQIIADVITELPGHQARSASQDSNQLL